MLAKLRDKGKVKNKRTIKIPNNHKNKLTSKEIALLTQLKQLDYILQITQTEADVLLSIKQAEAEFLFGSWLEYYVFAKAKKLVNKLGQALFDDCAWSVEDKGKGELDFVGVYQGQLIIGSCKTANKITSEYFKELEARASQLGEGMCTTMLISSFIPSTDQEQNIKKWTKDYNTITVLGNELVKIEEKINCAIKAKRI